MAENPHETFKKFPLVAHHEINEVFADQLVMMGFDAATLRIEFAVGRVEEVKSATPKGERHTVCRLVLTLPCATDLINNINRLAQQLAAAGAIKIDGGEAKPDTKPN